MTEIVSWLEAHKALLEHLGTFSLLVLLASVIALPIVIARLPEDYFDSDRRDGAESGNRPTLLSITGSLLKNILGIVMILAGIIMLILPGQGTLSILVGVGLTNFPGKFKLERKIVSQPAVLGTLNKIRSMAGKAPLTVAVSAPDSGES